MTGSTQAARPLRTALCTLAAGPHLELLEHSLPSVERFAERHDYELVVHRQLLAADRPASWSKVVALHDLCGSFDRVLWIDADAVVVDGTRDLAAELRPGRNLGLVAHRYEGNVVPNCGVWLLRGGSWTQRFLEDVWTCRDLVEHRWWENAAVLRLLGYRLQEPIRPERVTPASRRLQELDPAWNSIPAAPVAHPFIVHLAGKGHAERLETMAQLAKQLR